MIEHLRMATAFTITSLNASRIIAIITTPM